jgi:hypothetical protein
LFEKRADGRHRSAMIVGEVNAGDFLDAVLGQAAGVTGRIDEDGLRTIDDGIASRRSGRAIDTRDDDGPPGAPFSALPGAAKPSRQAHNGKTCHTAVNLLHGVS